MTKKKKVYKHAAGYADVKKGHSEEFKNTIHQSIHLDL